nr:unnamed protein product [Spirometra erinaceieuropaei]
MKNLVDNFVCKINGGTSHSQTIYWNVDSDLCQLNEEDVAEPFSNHLHPTGSSNAETADYHDLELDIGASSLDKEEGVEKFPDNLHHTRAFNLETAEGHDAENSTGHHCNWRLIRRKHTMTEYYGPCDNMRNMTESAIAMSEDRFIYHDFDKIRTRQYAILYWIIDTSNYKISNFYCEDDQGILCSLNDSENKCHLQSFDDVAIYTHKLEHTAEKLESLQCVLNDKYKSRKSVIWDDNYFPHSERTHRHH